MLVSLADLVGGEIAVGLRDKSIEIRLQSSQKLEGVCRDRLGSINAISLNWLEECMEAISTDLLRSVHPHFRSGGVHALSSIVIAVGDSLPMEILDSVTSLALMQFVDDDARVRYYACESVFNICMVSRVRLVPLFPALFEGLCRVYSDSDHDARQAAYVLDRLLREIIVEYLQMSQPRGNLSAILLAIESRLMYPSVYVKQLCLSWLSLLHVLPSFGLIQRLPHIYPPLLSMFASPKRDISIAADGLLTAVLRSIEESSKDVPYEALLEMLLKLARFHANLPNARSKIVLFEWIRTIVGKVALISGDNGKATCSPGMVAEGILAVVRAMNSTDKAISDTVTEANEFLFQSFTQDRLIPLSPHMTHALESILSSPHTPQCLTAVIEWLQRTSEHTPLASLALLLSLKDPRILRLCFKQFDTVRVIEEFLTVGRDGNSVELLMKAYPGSVGELVACIVHGVHVTREDELMLNELLKRVVGDSEFALGEEVLTRIVNEWGSLCPVGVVGVCIRSGKWGDALRLSAALRVSHERGLEQLVGIFESPPFAEIRLALVDDTVNTRDLVKCLLRIAMVLPQHNGVGTGAFGILLHRLQLVNVFKAL